MDAWLLIIAAGAAGYLIGLWDGTSTTRKIYTKALEDMRRFRR